MPQYGLLRDYRFGVATEDIRGASLYGSDDEKLGKIDDVIFDHSTGNIGYVVVDTGGWLKTKKFIVPSSRLHASLQHKDDFASDLTKKQVENFPPYDERHLESEEKWTDYEGRYKAHWETGPVMHRAESDRNITPTTQQLQGNQESIRASEGLGSPHNAGVTRTDAEASVKAAATPTERVVPAGTDSVVIPSTATGIGARFDTFQDRLRERRKEAIFATTQGNSDLKKAV
jgi:PRC-barrel domain